MVILIGGGTHTGKTVLAQKLLEKYRYPYLSIDHIKMGLIRAGYTNLKPDSSDEALTGYLWPVVREMIKTAIENRQNLIIEGCYIPFDYKKDFTDEYLDDIKYICLIFTRRYIEKQFDKIIRYENEAEERMEKAACSQADMTLENERNLRFCQKYSNEYYLIDEAYQVDITL
jgi:2-phosphoglycerate kinase